MKDKTFVTINMDIEWCANSVANLNAEGLAEFFDELIGGMLTQKELHAALSKVNSDTFAKLNKYFNRGNK